jgi:hypothetical protein
MFYVFSRKIITLGYDLVERLSMQDVQQGWGSQSSGSGFSAQGRVCRGEEIIG